MIISRTPFRISFVGGGTDLESYYSAGYGRVLSTSIDKYIYVCVKRPVHDIQEKKFRIAWSQHELKDNIDEIEHPIVRETFRFLKIDHPTEVVTFADVPAQTGLGSSSAFTVGLLQALYAMRGEAPTKHRLASEAAHIEIDILGRNIGKQDHFAAAYGNLNIFSFESDGSVRTDPVFYNPDTKQHLESRLMLFYTALQRDASKVLKEQRDSTEEKRAVLDSMRDLVEPLRDVFIGKSNPARMGEILHESWLLKRSLTGGVSSTQIDEYYEAARRAGAIGGKLLGAGGGGFLLLYAEPDRHALISESLKALSRLTFRFDDAGSRITYYDER